METNKMLELIAALNAFGKVYFAEDSIVLLDHDKEGSIVDKYTITRRPVANEDGIEVWKFVARRSKSV